MQGWMKWMAGFFALTLLVSIPAEDGQALLKRCRKAAKALMQTLLLRLNREFGKGGALRALQVCSEVAQELTKQVGERYRVRIRRVSLKYRNPADKPDEWEIKVLKRWEKLKRQKRSLKEAWGWQRKGKKRLFRYMKPILITQPLCLSCHGDPQKLDPKVKAFLRKRYPNDKAVGYDLNDLRGAISVIVIP